jgi:hypothetical protein
MKEQLQDERARLQGLAPGESPLRHAVG